MRILVKETGAIISDLVLDQSPIFIGSRSDCAVHLPDMQVGEQHARIDRDVDGKWSLTPLGGRCPTLFNGHVLRQARAVSNGDQIAIRAYTLNLYLEFQEDSEELAKLAAEETESRKYPVPFGTLSQSRRQDTLLTPSQVDAFVDLASKLQQCMDVAAVIDFLLDDLIDRFGPKIVWIGLRARPGGPLEIVQGRDYRGRQVEAPRLYQSLVHRCMGRGLNVLIPKFEDGEQNSAIAAVLPLDTRKLGFVYLESRPGKPPYSEREFQFIMAIGTLVAHRLGQIGSAAARTREAVSMVEGDAVRLVQDKMDPHLVPNWDGLQVAVHCSPGKEQAGDVYDLMALPNGAAAFLLGHVTADGATAMLGLMEARSAFRIGVLNSEMPHAILSKLNWLFNYHSDPILMDVAVVMVDPRTGALLHCTVGALRCLVVSQNGSIRRLSVGNSVELGKSRSSEFATRKGLLGPGESMVMCTPGVFRLKDERGQLIDEQQFLDSLGDGFGLSARAALDETLADLTPFLADGYNPADCTMLFVHRG